MHNKNTRIACTALALLALAACSDDGSAGPDSGNLQDAASGPDAATNPAKTVFGGSRPVTLSVPKSYDASKSWPLVLLLHGYGATGWVQERLLGYSDLVDREGILLASPNGTLDNVKSQFWNATDACCNFNKSTVDDSAYLAGLIAEIKKEYTVDPGRVYFIGHSNGGFMSFRMACDHADKIAAVISLAGATFLNKGDCQPSATVSVVQIHGTKDDAVEYKGGTTGSTKIPFPGAEQTVALWAGYNGCGAAKAKMRYRLDLDLAVAGAETEVERFNGCPKGIDVELWTLHDSGHVPIPTAAFAAETWKFFKGHPKP